MRTRSQGYREAKLSREKLELESLNQVISYSVYTILNIL